MLSYRKHRKHFMTEIKAVPYFDVMQVVCLVTRYKLLMGEFSSILQRQAFAVK